MTDSGLHGATDTFPAALLNELYEGRVRLRRRRDKNLEEAMERLRLLTLFLMKDLGPLVPYARRHEAIDMSRDEPEADYRIALPGWPYILVRYGWRGGEWVRLSFSQKHPELTWAVLPLAGALDKDWKLAADRPEALALAESVVMSSNPGALLVN
jgi:hypothetical protein